MTAHDYLGGRRIEEVVAAENLSFYAIIQAAMRKADSRNLAALQRAFPEQWTDLRDRYAHARGSDGLLPAEIEAAMQSALAKGTVCAVCGGTAEVSHPDGRGDQTHYCGAHEPVNDGSVGR